MWFFKKKRTTDLVKEDRELVNYNRDTVNILLELAKDDEDLKKELKQLQNELQYLIPSKLETVLNADKKIKSALNEVKTYLAGKEKSKISASLTDVRVLIAERNRNLK